MTQITLLDEVEEAIVTFISNGYTIEYSGDTPDSEEDFSRSTRKYFFAELPALLSAINTIMDGSISEGNITIEDTIRPSFFPKTMTEFNSVVIKFFDNGYILEYSGRDEKLNWVDTAHFCGGIAAVKFALETIEKMELTR
jgi:hypothetical protein